MEDLIYFKDEAGNEIGLVMLDNFELEGKKYALFATPEETGEGEIYVMKMEEKEEEISFSMPDDDEMAKVTPVIMEMLEHANGGCTHDCCSCHSCHGDHDDCCDGEDCHCGEDE